MNLPNTKRPYQQSSETDIVVYERFKPYTDKSGFTKAVPSQLQTIHERIESCAKKNQNPNILDILIQQATMEFNMAYCLDSKKCTECLKLMQSITKNSLQLCKTYDLSDTYFEIAGSIIPINSTTKKVDEEFRRKISNNSSETIKTTLKLCDLVDQSLPKLIEQKEKLENQKKPMDPSPTPEKPKTPSPSVPPEKPKTPSPSIPPEKPKAPAPLSPTPAKLVPPTTNTKNHRQSMLFSWNKEGLSLASVVGNFVATLDCFHSVCSLKNEVGCQKFESIAEECKKRLEQTKTAPNSFNLNENERLAILIYTWEYSSGNREENVYFVLNKCLQDKQPEKLQNWRGYLYYLQSALQKITATKTTLYRGIDNKKIVENEYTQGRTVVWSGITSTSSDIRTSKTFVQNSKLGVLMKITALTSRPISEYSKFQEFEHILLPNSRFVVTSNGVYFDEKEGFYMVDLLEQSMMETFKF